MLLSVSFSFSLPLARDDLTDIEVRCTIIPNTSAIHNIHFFCRLMMRSIRYVNRWTAISYIQIIMLASENVVIRIFSINHHIRCLSRDVCARLAVLVSRCHYSTRSYRLALIFRLIQWFQFVVWQCVVVSKRSNDILTIIVLYNNKIKTDMNPCIIL